MYDIVKGYLEKVNVTPEYIVKTNEKNPHDFKLIDVHLYFQSFIEKYLQASMNVRKLC